MSWPQWPTAGTMQAWPGAVAAGGTPAVGPLTTPGTPYTPEQWAAMQQQNWQQWMQWQQQYQQWQQQYGEQYQKSVNALTSQSIAAPLMSLQPPLPAADTKIAPPPLPETKPPLPPDEPPKASLQMTQNPPPMSYNTSIPPPNMAQMQSACRDTNPMSAQNRFGNSKYPNVQTFNSQQTNQQVLSQSQSTQLPSLLTLNVAKPEVTEASTRTQNYRSDKPEYGKRPLEYSEHFDDIKKNRWENQPYSADSNKSWSSNQSNQRNSQRSTNQRAGSDKPSIQRPNVEELSETEKIFDKQFEEWEAQFNKWKEQNAGHPDKQQYKEYEAKWESWRTQLLERREQMRRKRLGLLGANISNSTNRNQTLAVNTQPSASTLQILVSNNEASSADAPSSGKQANNESVTNKLEFNAPAERQTPDKKEENTFEKPDMSGTSMRSSTNVNKSDKSEFDNTLLFAQPPKEQRTNIRQRRLSSRSDNESNESSFLKSTIYSNEIPGLDLVKDHNEKVIDNPLPKQNPEIKGPDLEAISKGINSILGDEKLMSMLSMVTQNKRPDESNFMNEPKQPEPIQETNSNVQDEFNSTFPSNDSSMNCTDSNFRNDFNTNNNQSLNEYDRNNFNRNLNQDWHMNRGPNNSNNFGRNFSGSNDFRRNLPNDFIQQVSPNRKFGLNNMNQQDSQNYSERSNFRQEPNNFNQGSFNRNISGSRSFSPNSLTSGPPLNDFNQISPNRKPNDVSQRSLNDSKEFKDETANRNSNVFNQGVMNFNRDSPNKGPFDGNQGFNRSPVRPGNFNQGFSNSPAGSNFKQNPSNRGPVNLIEKFTNREPQNNYNHTSPNKNCWRANDFIPNKEQQKFPNRSSWPNETVPSNSAQDFRNSDQLSTHNVSHKYGDNEPSFRRNQSGFINQDMRDFDDNSKDENFDRLSENSNEFSRNQIGPDPNINRWTDQSRHDYPGPDRPRFPSERYSYPNSDPYNRGGGDRYWDEALILKPVTVVDYGHKSLNKLESESFIEPIQTFDYGHSSRNVDRSFEKNIDKSLSHKYSRYNDLEYNKPLNQYEQVPPEPPKICSFNRNKSFEDDKPYGMERRSYDNRKPIDRNNKYYDSRSYRFENNKVSREHSNEREVKNEQFLNKSNPEVKFEEKSSSVTMIEDLLSPPGRNTRPPRIVIILRGPPGSGKTFLAKLIKDKEVEQGGSAPRILSLDDYFMVEQDKETIEEETGRKTIIKEMVYEFEECMELSYRQSLEKAFKKTITDGFFPFIILDCINDKIKYFSEMWSFAKQNGFQVYVSQMELDVSACTKRNIHHRSEVEIERLIAGWEPTPSHYLILDAASLIQAGCISEVEMEEVPEQNDEEKDEDELEDHVIVSKWERMEQTGEKLARLDGISKPLRPRTTMEDYLQLDEDIPQERPGEKRVRWADLEERRRQEKIRAIGFVVGQTDWDRMMDPTQGSSALTQTKYIERVRRF